MLETGGQSAETCKENIIDTQKRHEILPIIDIFTRYSPRGLDCGDRQFESKSTWKLAHAATRLAVQG